jgi:hypothetical protein
MESLGCYKSKQNTSLFYKECSNLLNQDKQAKFHWLQNPAQTSGDNMNNVKT